MTREEAWERCRRLGPNQRIERMPKHTFEQGYGVFGQGGIAWKPWPPESLIAVDDEGGHYVHDTRAL